MLNVTDVNQTSINITMNFNQITIKMRKTNVLLHRYLSDENGNE